MITFYQRNNAKKKIIFVTINTKNSTKIQANKYDKI